MPFAGRLILRCSNTRPDPFFSFFFLSWQLPFKCHWGQSALSLRESWETLL
jgi:hypothetical protein